ncbi:hypothetical protein [Proteus mirabilis]|uniref:hypothetical protein n=1 Tax=Proteus mirabilis TaxID=584 RepID=UPI0034D56109
MRSDITNLVISHDLYIKDGKHVFTLSGLNESQSFDNFKAGIEWAYVRKLALQTEQLVGKQNVRH